MTINLQVDIGGGTGRQGRLAGARAAASEQREGGALQDVQGEALRVHRHCGGEWSA